ncbi:hypothetical protein [Endozoicomonas sp. 8E]|uniref:type II toxin-antitoxin system RelE/ParE family toxin n=1 Tax=Endozoicomonas sp. 8E TaxID=3035692 RepID=UPI0029391CA7|nr:hypothetical protein [Endozoicomonas sp. 8E]WOG26506.1 hypothetical protein P6910_18430 [Endozoicomonas sp. 8E]
MQSIIASFKDKATADIFNDKASRLARKVCPQSLWRMAARNLNQLDSVLMLDELKVPPGNCLEALTRDRKGRGICVIFLPESKILTRLLH